MCLMSKGLNIAFAGTPGLAATILERLITDGQHHICHVYTQPDRPAGRGKKIHSSPVKQLAVRHGLPLSQPLNKLELEHDASLANIDLLVVAAYGIIVTDKVLNAPRHGCINIHTSLLPRWRGAAPIQHSILAGDRQTGITVMQMDSGLDTGDILLQRSCPISAVDTAGILHDRLANMGAECLLEILPVIANEALTPVSQQDALATYASKITKADARIDWSDTAISINRLVRAMNPSPVAYTEILGAILRVWEATPLDVQAGNTPPGTILDYTPAGLDICAGDQGLRISKLQLPGKKPLAIRDFYNGNPSFWQAVTGEQ